MVKGAGTSGTRADSGGSVMAWWLHSGTVMSSIALFALSQIDFPAIPPEAVAPSAVARLQAWLSGKSRARLARAERAQLRRLWPDGRGDVVTLDWQRSSAASHLARLDAVANGGVDAVASVGALAGASDVGLLLSEIKRVLRPGGRFLFVEPVAARAGTRLRRMQGAGDRLWRVGSGNPNPLRDLWNDLKAARFGRLDFQHVNLAGLAGVPIPHLVGEAALPATATIAAAAMRSTAARHRNAGALGVPRLSWRDPPFTFFG
jgi:SAM-dependent methyltransferase